MASMPLSSQVHCLTLFTHPACQRTLPPWRMSPLRLQCLPNVLECIEALFWQRTPADALDIRPDLLGRTGPEDDSITLFQ